MRKHNVCILFGGMSPEHAVSLRSAESVLNNLNPEKYTGPTLIYQPVEDTSVYISPTIHIAKRPHFFGGIFKMYAYEGVKNSASRSYSMREKYPKYDLSEDERIKKALVDLQKQWKDELNKIREEEIQGDFNDT